MTAAFGRGLDAAVRNTSRRAFRSALAKAVEALKEEAPFNTGDTVGGIVVRDLFLTAPIFKARILSTTTNQGFDYPSLLENVQTILPTGNFGGDGEFLHFQTSSGDWVRTRMIENQHYRWWTNGLGEPPVFCVELERFWRENLTL